MCRCIANCTECHNICVATASYCMSMGGEHVTAHHMGILLDCADTCRMSADFMLRGSDMHQHTCGLCAEACTRCADECARFGEDAQMQACVYTCRHCAESCRAMAASCACAICSNMQAAQANVHAASGNLRLLAGGS